MPHLFQHAIRELTSEVLPSTDNNNDSTNHQQQAAAGATAEDPPLYYFDLARVAAGGKDGAAGLERLAKLPLSIKIWLEMLVRKCDGSQAGSRPQHVDAVLHWAENQGKLEVPFWPARVLLQDFTGVPAIADLAAMRDSVVQRALAGASSSSPSSSSSSTSAAAKAKQAEADLLAQELVNPLIPVDLVVDHSIQVLEHGTSRALRVNESIEMRQNRERFELVQWAGRAFHNFRIVPPGSGIVHQVNLELLARVVFAARAPLLDGPPASSTSSTGALAHTRKKDWASSAHVMYPDTLVGTDSHTTMVNGIGCLGWGVGGIEAEAAMLGEPLMMLLPPVVGVRIVGELPAVCTATDVVLVVTAMLRQANVVGKFVEFFGEGVKQLTAADRATISNMAPEYGATCGLFGVDDETLHYLEQTGRRDVHSRVGRYFAEAFGPAVHDPSKVVYSTTLVLDLSAVTPAVAGPKRPQDLVPLSALQQDFKACLANPQPGHKSFVSSAKKKQPQKQSSNDSGGAAQLPPSYPEPLEFKLGGPQLLNNNNSGGGGAAVAPRELSFPVNHGFVVLAAITSCTNTSNPATMIAAGLLARNARRHGLAVRPYVKTSLSPGSRVVTEYLTASGLLRELEQLGFFIAGYGCMTCIGNSGPLVPGVSEFIREKKLVAAAVLSGNRNFEGRVHPDTLANYLASPPLVVALALAGTVNIDFTATPLGISATDGKTPVFLKDVWPSKKEIQETIAAHVSRAAFEAVYAGGGAEANVWKGNETWQQMAAGPAVKAGATAPSRFQWNPASTYIQPPPFFLRTASTSAAADDAAAKPLVAGARCLLYLGNSVTTDHISPAGSIATNSDAGVFLLERGVPVADFNSYGSRRGNDLVMVRGTFANVRLGNKLVGNGMTGPVTIHLPSGEQMSVFAASQRYRAERGGAGTPLVVLAGKEYGSGSSRDWAAKGPALLGVKVVIAESYERIHRSNLVGLGILPLQFKAGESAASLGLTGREVFTVTTTPATGGVATATVTTDTGIRFEALQRVDTAAEQQYMAVGGILPYVVDRLMSRSTVVPAQTSLALGKL